MALLTEHDTGDAVMRKAYVGAMLALAALSGATLLLSSIDIYRRYFVKVQHARIMPGIKTPEFAVMFDLSVCGKEVPPEVVWLVSLFAVLVSFSAVLLACRTHATRP